MRFFRWLLRLLKPKGERPAYVSPRPANLGEIPLFELSPMDKVTIDDACQGIAVFGAPGSGKTSGSGQMIARSLLRAGMGGVVCCAKPDEADRFCRYATEEGRHADVILMSRAGTALFNFFDYELKQSGGNVENLVHLFTRVLEVGGRSRQHAADPFWEDALKQLLRNAIALLVLAGDSVSLMDVYELVQSAPLTIEEGQSAAWRESSACGLCLDIAKARVRGDADREHDYRRTADYWLREYPPLPEKTRQSVLISFTGVVDPFLRNPMYRLFCTETTVTPEDAFRGKIIILDLSVKTEGFSGRFAQALFKICFQNAAERRRGSDDLFPVFLYSDEAHYFIGRSDAEFLTTARSARVVTVLLTQTTSNYYAEFAGNRDAANAVLGTLNLKIFHANNDVETNDYASKTIGQRWQERLGFSRGSSSGMTPGAASDSTGAQVSEQLAASVLPSDLISLPTGGPRNGFVVVGIACRSGAPFAYSGTNFLTVEFSQTQQ